MSICLLTHAQVQKWESTGLRPSCKFHHHAPYKEAQNRVDDDEGFWVPGQRAIVIFPCVLEYVWENRLSAGFQVKQFVPIR